ncbi:uncharacterized protein LOC128120200 [Peromyscus californicus insignis]|uniref:uncharacterized protein LOC128120200 n=1 Tax=Peromyscus californicus insignis TaxID=564181 RepID=UPI0022A67B39|nr:uncharacterized protein LOC128120200 [Peromyscus californicus insignis]
MHTLLEFRSGGAGKVVSGSGTLVEAAGAPRLQQYSAPSPRWYPRLPRLPLRQPLLGARGPAQAAAGAAPHPSPPRRHRLYIHRAQVPLPPLRRGGRAAAAAAAAALVPRVPSPHHARGSSPGVRGHQRPQERLALVLGSVLLLSRPGAVPERASAHGTPQKPSSSLLVNLGPKLLSLETRRHRGLGSCSPPTSQRKRGARLHLQLG